IRQYHRFRYFLTFYLSLNLLQLKGVMIASLILDIVSVFARNLVPAGLIIALGLFGWLALRVKTLRSLQVELSIFLIIWIIAELLGSLLVAGVISCCPSLQLIGFDLA